MTLPTIFFVLIGAISLAAAVGVITSRQTVHSALFLLANFVTLAILYITLDAQFLAAAQVIIYAGGIVILILFVIMLIGSEKLPSDIESSGYRAWTPLVGIALGFLLLAAIGIDLGQSFAGIEPDVAGVEGGVPEAVGMALFQEYLLPFELASVLLLVALLGALLLAKRPGLRS